MQPRGADQSTGAGDCSTFGQGWLQTPAEPQPPTVRQEPGGKSDVFQSLLYQII